MTAAHPRGGLVETIVEESDMDVSQPFTVVSTA